MKADQIRVGGCYVSEKKGLIREIVSAEGGKQVFWRSYNLTDGEPVAHRRSCCSKQAILRWADREADAVEIARLQREEAHAQEQEEGRELINEVLKQVPGKMLLGEVHRRGLIKDS
jgi:hypothetical protein